MCVCIGVGEGVQRKGPVVRVTQEALLQGGLGQWLFTNRYGNNSVLSINMTVLAEYQSREKYFFICKVIYEYQIFYNNNNILLIIK